MSDHSQLLTTNAMLDSIAKKHGNCTDYRLSKLLRTSVQNVSGWRKGSVMSPDFAPRVATLLKFDAAYVMACLEHERVGRLKAHGTQRDVLEDTGEILSTWARIAEKFRPTLPAILAALLLPLFGAFSEPAQASTVVSASDSSAVGLYIMRSSRSRRKRPATHTLERLTRWFRTEFPATFALPA